MDRVILEVDNGVARAWRNIAPALREKYERKITELLLELKEADFANLLNKAGIVAEKNGLTEDKLNQLLSEED